MGAQKRVAPRQSEERGTESEASDRSEEGRRHKKVKLTEDRPSPSLARPASLADCISSVAESIGSGQKEGEDRLGSTEKTEGKNQGKGKEKQVEGPPADRRHPLHSTASAPVASTSTSNAAPVNLTPAPNTISMLAPPIPSKRPVHAGTLRRLAGARPPPSRSVRLGSTLSGAKISGPSKDLNDGKDEEEIWVKLKNGLGIGGYLKRGVGAFRDRRCRCLSIHGMGAAIPLALSLGLAIRDALPGGSSDAEMSSVQMEVTTGSVEVSDEITPEDEDDDLLYQNRIKSTVSIQLSVRDVMPRSGPRFDLKGRGRGVGPNARGRKRRGGPRS
ncbi:hypothetical protein MVLG_03561 [Microbotryum lychnidis-dioicae p1A1 Lamole]|uniref:Uncharacterized protein n=1 Tax=Microbotryum lychnidis-dioicae (strain p1A1 Lamole / MvSl-1064) TaxID=683840 RepID=U5H8K4_USTV1|nr:hypothetical protein MVLG_03561 [Microbotryum lychnidis-dioicae p1A1 Lamole]|eukprot:KDE06146.1 hypothetical protein MVLG_03561 [Microbotryum lychnidis-dioicae p1A1 Lamole]